MTVKNRIRELFIEFKELAIKELVGKLSVSKQVIHRYVNQLVEEGFIEKLGKPPKTLYRLVKVKKTHYREIYLDQNQKEFLNENFLIITNKGELLEGLQAFDSWCDKRKQPLEKTVKEYIQTVTKYKKYIGKNGLIDGTAKMKNTYGEEAYLDGVYYLDFYAIERFGKTHLGNLLHFAKLGQNKFLMQKIIQEIKGKVEGFISENNFDAICYVPPTVRREVQIMKYLEENLNIALPLIDIQKIGGLIPIPQKALSKLDERIENAENSFSVTEIRKFKKVLLIDDAVGSGATLHQIAEKIKIKKIAPTVVGLAIVGSFKGFDVITDI